MNFTADFDALPSGNTQPNLDQMYADAGTKYGIDPAILKAQAITESHQNPNEISYDANGKPVAHGIMQIIPANYKALNVTDPYDPAQSIDAAANLLKQNLVASNGDLPTALKMYHGGTDTSNWGPKTNSYPNKVLANMPKPAPIKDLASDFDSVPNLPQQVAQINANAQPPSMADSAYAGLGQGVTSLGLGAEQLAGKGLSALGFDVGKTLTDNANKNLSLLDQGNQPYAQANPKFNLAGQVTGNIAAMALPANAMGDVAEGANLVNKLINAAKIGAVTSLAQPVTDQNSNFWTQKALQAGAGAVGGAAGYGIGATGGYLAGKTINGVKNLGNKVISAVTGTEIPEIAANASPELQNSVANAIKNGQKIDPSILGRQVEADSLPVPISLTSGQASQNPIQISMERNLRGKNPDLPIKFNDQNSQLINNVYAISKNVAPDVSIPDNYHAGTNLIDAIQDKVNANTQATQAAYKALSDANGGSLPLDGQTFAIDANKALHANMKGAFLPSQVQNILTDFQTGKQPMTFENFENLRTILANSARSSNDGNVIGAVNTVRNVLENMPMSTDSAAIKQLADTARGLAKQGFNLEDKIPAYKAVASGTANPDDFVKKYIINGKTSDIQNLAQVIPDNPDALQTMKASVINYLKDNSVGQGGNFSQAGYNKALDALSKNSKKLDVLFSPDEINQIKTLGNVARNIQAQPTGSFVNNSNTDVANAARGIGNTAAHLVDMATHSPAGSFVNGVVQNNIARKASASQLNSILQPGAGIGTQGAVSQFLLNKMPNLMGRTATIPLSSLVSKAASNGLKTPAYNRGNNNN